MTPPPHRHQIAWLSDLGWQRVLARRWDEEAQACLLHWARHRLPLVVTRQPVGGAPDEIALGLSAPRQWGRRRISLALPRRDVLYFDEFPRASEVLGMLPGETRARWRALCAALAASGCTARVYGSYGWRHFSGLDYPHAASDIDLWVAVSDAEQADGVAAHFVAFSAAAEKPRLDGELVFATGAGVAWREWANWRTGLTRSVLVKYIDGAVLARSPFWQKAGEALEITL